MNITNEQIQQEAAFADRHYQEYAEQLAINETMFRTYSCPEQHWDWRQYGAAALGSIKRAETSRSGLPNGRRIRYFMKPGAKVTAIDLSPVGIELRGQA